MSHAKLKEISKLVEADFLATQAQFRRIVSEETRLRLLLRDLDAQEQNGRIQIQTDPTLRSIGADVAWYRWISMTRERLNMQLARVLAEKGRIEERFREKGGRSAVADALVLQSRLRKCQKVQHDALQELDSHFVLTKTQF